MTRHYFYRTPYLPILKHSNIRNPVKVESFRLIAVSLRCATDKIKRSIDQCQGTIRYRTLCGRFAFSKNFIASSKLSIYLYSALCIGFRHERWNLLLQRLIKMFTCKNKKDKSGRICIYLKINFEKLSTNHFC